MYHRIASVGRDSWSLCVSPEHFAEHLDVLRKFRRPGLDRLCPGGWSWSGGLSVAITFDDGYADNLHAALPLLTRYDTPATFFIATGYIDSPREFWWDELERIVHDGHSPDEVSKDELHLSLYRELQPLCHEVRQIRLDRMLAECEQPTAARQSHRILTAAELEKLAANELIEIGAHTVTHPLLAAQSVETQRAELRESKTWLESLLGRRVTSFSYPYGGNQHFTDDTVEAARDSGFARACTTIPKSISSSDAPHQWGRIQVPDLNGDQFEEFLFNLEG
jgi:peptidoglycan/xylan/chitin deacetylase (PgdA/CDA1 family)